MNNMDKTLDDANIQMDQDVISLPSFRFLQTNFTVLYVIVSISN
jgi:hypothetical protein